MVRKLAPKVQRINLLPIIFLTGFHDIPATVQAIKAGASGVVKELLDHVPDRF
jgi:FixJ family two-component response regulator